MYDLYKAIMNYCDEQDPEATIIFLGDACDRGPDGYQIMKELLDNPYVIYLKGNHEDMFCKAAREIHEYFSFKEADKERVQRVLSICRQSDYKYNNIRNSLYNGGLSTLTDWVLDGMPMDFVERIENLPTTFSYNNCDFCHSAGYYKTFSEVAAKEYNGEQPNENDIMYLIWTRNGLEDDWMSRRILVFGHTPTPYIPDYIRDMRLERNWEVQPLKWGDISTTGEKLDMDTGAAFTGRAYVLNVLTMKAQGFEDEDFSKKEVCEHRIKKIGYIQF